MDGVIYVHSGGKPINYCLPGVSAPSGYSSTLITSQTLRPCRAWRMQDFVQSLSDRSQLRNKSNCSYKIFHRASSITPVSGSLTFANQL